MAIKKTSSKIDSLQMLRGFAAIAVMFFHGSSIIHDRLNYTFLDNYFSIGYLGVDIFFVLSGYIILYSSTSGKDDFVSFIKKRIIRIYPVYILVTLGLVLVFLAAPTEEQAYKGNINIIAGSLLLWPQKTYVLGVAWTLSYEIIFYLFFAFTYFKNPKYLTYAFIIWISIILSCQFFNVKTGYYSLDALLNPMILEFCFGCMIANIHRKLKTFKYSLILILIGLVLFNIAPMIEKEMNELSRVYLFGIPAALTIFGSLYLQLNIPRLLTYLGDASYSLYLLHGTVLSLLIKILDKLNLSLFFSNFYGAVSLFICTIIISSCFYSLVEKNLQKSAQRLFLPRPQFST